MNDSSTSAPARPVDGQPDRRPWLIVNGLCVAAASLAAAAPLIARWIGVAGSVPTSLVMLVLLVGIGGGLRRARMKPSAILLQASSTPSADVSVIDEAWRELLQRYGWRLQVLAEQLRPELDALEDAEANPESVRRLYRVDHGVTRMRRIAGELRVFGGRASEEVIGPTSSLLDVIRVAASAIERYERVALGPVADLAVVAYAADDVALLLAMLADNATRYSPGAVTISAHLLGNGSVMVRIEDAGGLGIDPGFLAWLNAAMAGPVQPVDMRAGRHTGFAVAHRLARKHGLRVHLARRRVEGTATACTGTTAMVVVPVSLLCEIPGPPRPLRDGTSSAAAPAPTWVREAQKPSPGLAATAADPAGTVLAPPIPDGLPVRQRGSLRHSSGREHSPGQVVIRESPVSGPSFADDVSAFTAPAAPPRPSTPAGGGTDHPTEAEGQRQ